MPADIVHALSGVCPAVRGLNTAGAARRNRAAARPDRRRRAARSGRRRGSVRAFLKEALQMFEPRQVFHGQAADRNGAVRRRHLIAVSVAEIRMQLDQTAQRIRAVRWARARPWGAAAADPVVSPATAAPAQCRLLLDRNKIEHRAVVVHVAVRCVGIAVIVDQVIAHLLNGADITGTACCNADVLLGPDIAQAIDELSKRSNAYGIVGHGTCGSPREWGRPFSVKRTGIQASARAGRTGIGRLLIIQFSRLNCNQSRRAVVLSRYRFSEKIVLK